MFRFWVLRVEDLRFAFGLEGIWLAACNLEELEPYHTSHNAMRFGFRVIMLGARIVKLNLLGSVYS